MSKTLMYELARRVSVGLNDQQNFSYSYDSDIMPALTEADYVILTARPDVNTETVVIAAVAGSLQEIAADHLRLIDVRCNLDAAGTVEGRDIRRMERAEVHPLWRTLPQASVIEGYFFDDRTPREFECYPPAAVGAKLRAVVSAPFASYGTIDATTESALPPTYDSAKVEWALYRCYTRSEDSNMRARGSAHLQIFNTLMGIKSERDAIASPKSGQQDS